MSDFPQLLIVIPIATGAVAVVFGAALLVQWVKGDL